MLAVAYDHQDAGRRVFIVTAAAQELADALAACSPSTAASARSSPRSGTACTPARPAGYFVYRADKARAVQELAEREGIDLAASYAYSDSESDLPMLRLVGHPVAVNPDRELFAIARGRGLGDPALRPSRTPTQGPDRVLAAAGAGGVGSAAVATVRRRPLARRVRAIKS